MSFTFPEDSNTKAGAVRVTSDGNNFFIPSVEYGPDGITPVQSNNRRVNLLTTTALAASGNYTQTGIDSTQFPQVNYVGAHISTDQSGTLYIEMSSDNNTLDTIRQHISRQKHLKASSLAHRVRAIKSLFKWLYEEEYIPRHPLLRLREPKLPQPIPKALTIDEIELLRDSCKSERDHALIEFFFATGCRVSEVYRINRDDIDWQRKSVTVLGKGNKMREVYFGSRASIWLKRYISHRTDNDSALFVTKYKSHRLPVHQIQTIFKTIAKRCGLEKRVHPHVLRHSLATTLLNQGAPLSVVQSILGHDKPETTQRYAVLSGTSRQQSYQRYFIQ